MVGVTSEGFRDPLSYLDKEKFEGEKISDFELRIFSDIKKLFEID